MKKRAKIICMLIFLFVLSAFSADAVTIKKGDTYVTSNDLIDIETLPVKDSISRFENAEFNIIVRNKGLKIDFFSIRVVDPEQWRWVRTEPLHYITSENKIYPQSEANFTLVFVPKEDTRIGIHNIILRVSLKEQGSSTEQILPIYVGRKGEQEYLPNINLDLSVQKKLDPREQNFLELIIDNNNYRELENINIILESNLFDSGRKELSTSLEPNEMGKTIEVPIRLDPLSSPEKFVVEATATIDDAYRFKSEKVWVEIVDYTGSLDRQQTLDSSFLKSVAGLELKNNGNSAKSELVKVQIGYIERFFTDTSPKALELMEDNKYYYAWEVSLNPQESKSFSYTTSYRGLFYLFVIILLILTYYYLTKSPVEIKKKVTNVETKEGGISELKVMLDIKNNSKVSIKELEIIDKIPNIAMFKEEHVLGTLHPSRIYRHEKEGTTLLKWCIEDLDPLEHRLITYKIKSRLSVVGGFNLPPATVRYRGHKGAKVTIRSNALVAN